MKVLCISSHSGCLANLEGLLAAKGYNVKSFYTYKVIPYVLNESAMDALWETYKEEWNGYDLIITGDSMNLAYVFLKHIQEVKPKLLVWIMNRYDNCTSHIPHYNECINGILNDSSLKKKVKLVPYTEYERIFAAERGVYLKEPVLLPYGEKKNSIDIPSYIETDESGMTAGPEDTVFLMHYGNDHEFMPFQEIFKSAGISVKRSQFKDVDELRKYKCVVHLPDAFSKFCAFEFLTSEIPVFLPTEEFFQQLNQQSRVLPNGKIEKYCFTVVGNLCPKPFVPLCEWYKYPNSKVYFNSLPDLIEKLKAFTKEDRAELILQMRKDAEYHKNSVKLTFDKLLADLFF
jgi:hypothetical protein